MTADHRTDHAFAEQLAAGWRSAGRALPSRRDVAGLVDTLLGLLFPQLSDVPEATAEDIEAGLCLLRRDLRRLTRGLTGGADAEAVAAAFTEQLPGIHDALRLDAAAIAAGDPAAESLDEVVAAYPGFLGIAVHRVAHALEEQGVQVLPRLLAEVAHTRTGIDIHPAARIGRSFCIDHGTGVVIGETAVVGDEVKIYQGVTLGALSVVKTAAGTKRHPTIEDRVVIYANATVLGGDTIVGHDSIVGGNVWLTHSVPPHSLVYHTSQVRLARVPDSFEPPDFVI